MPSVKTRSIPPPFSDPPLVDTLATVAVPVGLRPVAVVTQLFVWQLYPVGQHPPPSLLVHVNQPAGQAPVCWPALPPALGSMPSPVGPLTMVTPFDTSKVDEICGGHDVKAQSRPTWQQPPPL